MASIVAGLALALAAWAWWGRRETAPPASTRVIRAPISEVGYITFGRSAAVSPDGETVVFVGVGVDATLFRRRLDDLVPTPILGTEGGWETLFTAT